MHSAQVPELLKLMSVVDLWIYAIIWELYSLIC